MSRYLDRRRDRRLRDLTPRDIDAMREAHDRSEELKHSREQERADVRRDERERRRELPYENGDAA